MLSTPDLFFSYFVATVVAVRLWLFFLPTSGPTILGLRVHHYHVGLIGLLVAILLNWLELYAISLALVVDEGTYVAIGGRTHRDNYSSTSLAGTAVLVIVVFVVRGFLTGPFA